MIIGTAGHIDHGKTALVRALTGVDTDRLPEEKRRGITIELGFAPLELPGAGTVGIVDVPGHEAFVRTMVAGATGIDIALLVVAADEGVMPQTREHLAILTLLGTRAGVVALTKSDLVDAEWLELVRADVTEAVRGTPLQNATVVATSVTHGTGLQQLRDALDAVARDVPARSADDIFRMPIDRVFSVKGTGTVVTGTVWSGSLRSDASVMLQPAGRELRVRGVQAHGHSVSAAQPATRAAVALAGVEVGDVERGAWLVGDAKWSATLVMRAEVALAPDAAHALRPREWVRLHLGTADVGARVVSPGGAVAPGQRRACRVVLQEPVVARAGDRFVLRRASPVETIGGGIVVDPAPEHRRPRPWPLELRSPAERLRRLVVEAGRGGIERSQLPVRLGLRAAEVREVLEGMPDLVAIGARLFSRDDLSRISTDIETAVDAHHAAHPLDGGLAVTSLRARAGAGAMLVEEALGHLAQTGRLELRGSMIARPGWQPTLSQDQQRLSERLLSDLLTAGAEPPDMAALTHSHHSDVAPLLRMLERDGLVVAVEADRFYASESVRDLVSRLRAGMTKGRSHTPAELRDILGLSRKYLIPFLEYCDRQRITERREAGRVLLDA